MRANAWIWENGMTYFGLVAMKVVFFNELGYNVVYLLKTESSGNKRWSNGWYSSPIGIVLFGDGSVKSVFSQNFVASTLSSEYVFPDACILSPVKLQ